MIETAAPIQEQPPEGLPVVRIRVETDENGMVVLAFDCPVQTLALPPATAHQLGDMLRKQAKLAKR